MTGSEGQIIVRATQGGAQNSMKVADGIVMTFVFIILPIIYSILQYYFSK